MQKEIKLPLIKVVKALLVFAARGDVRYYLNGVHVRREVEITGDFIGGRYHAVIMGARV